MEEHFDYIIVGAGIEGSATALQLATRKKKTLLIEQFELGKSQGSSQGKSRIIRHSYEEDFFTRLTFEAYDDWFEIEKQTGNNIYKKTGLLVIEKPPIKHLNIICRNLTKFNQSFEYLDSDTLKNRFPQLNLPLHEAVYEADGGILRADVALKSIQDLFIKAGGYTKDKTKVIRIEPDEDKITIKTENEDYVANSVIICAGPWAPELLKSIELDLPLKPEKIDVTYWKEQREGTYNSDTFPCIIDHSNGFYSLPSLEYPGHAKVMLNLMGYNPGIINRIELLTKYIRDYFPELDSTAPSIEEMCYYTNTPDESFILDKHPRYNNIIIGAGFSGTGFKLAPVVGKILANFAEGKSQVYDVQPFRINRFTQQE